MKSKNGNSMELLMSEEERICPWCGEALVYKQEKVRTDEGTVEKSEWYECPKCGYYEDM